MTPRARHQCNEFFEMFSAIWNSDVTSWGWWHRSASQLNIRAGRCFKCPLTGLLPTPHLPLSPFASRTQNITEFDTFDSSSSKSLRDHLQKAVLQWILHYTGSFASKKARQIHDEIAWIDLWWWQMMHGPPLTHLRLSPVAPSFQFACHFL